ncbi:MAG: glycosyltransferase [Flammeovirgaceae bacterium]|nr:glycosyltransferase [Flammeovirgaceae bacterium]
MSKDVVAVFVKNLIPGTVKTRLAKDLGMDLAMEVYKELVGITAQATDFVKVDKCVYYSEYVELEDQFDDEKYNKHIQEGKELGQRMQNAFYDAFEAGYDKMILIGSDVPDISSEIIEAGFKQLDKNDIVIGPSEDGGFYLIGMKIAHENLLSHQNYGHDEVLENLLEEVESRDLSVARLKELIDIDTQEDMKKAGVEIVFEEDEDLNEEFREENDNDY